MNTPINIADVELKKINSNVEQLLARGEEIAKLLGFTVEQLYTDHRVQPLSTVRKAIMYLIRQHEFYTLNQIAELFNKRNHATILHACRTGSDLVEIKDERFLHYIKLLSNGIYQQEEERQQIPHCASCAQRQKAP